jgi:amidase
MRSAGWNEWQTGRRESTLSADEVERSIFEWERLQRAFISFMERYDLIVCPAAEQPACPHAELTAQEFIYTMPYSLTGWPVAVVRAGASPEGLPIGVQLVGAPWRDDVALAAARAVEDALGGWQPPPE